MSKMKSTLLAILVLFSNLLLAQVYIFTEPDFAFDGTNLTSVLEKHVEEVQAKETLRVPDSVVFNLEIGADGQLESAKNVSGYSAEHINKLDDLLRSTSYAAQKGKLIVKVVYPGIDEKAYSMYQLDEVPETQLCNEYDSKNEVFRHSCFRYLNTENLKNIDGPDSIQITQMEGFVNAKITVGVDGHVREVTFDPESFDPNLNDLIVAQLENIQFLDGGFIGNKQVNYYVTFEESFMYLETGKELTYLAKGEELYKNKSFYPAAYMMLKAKKLGYKFTKNDVNQLASAYLLEGDSATAFNWWRSNFESKELEGMKMAPYLNGDVYEVELVEYKKQEPDENGAVSFAIVERKPVFPGCEKIKDEEEQFNCFNTGIMKHIGQTFIFPEVARQAGIQGKMYVNFVIEKDGSVNVVTMARGVHPYLDLEAIRVICNLPRMEPAFQRDKTVRMQYTVPINARLQ